MKLKTILVCTICSMLVFTGVINFPTAHTFTNGAPEGYSGAPGDNTCASGCHGGVATSKDAWLTTDIPASGYEPGVTYNVSLKCKQTGRSKFGFQCSVRNSTNAHTGTLISGSGSALTTTQKFVNHTGSGTFGIDSVMWNFQWTAPSSGTGDVTFYAAYNAANSNNAISGDIIFKSVVIYNEAIGAGITRNYKDFSIHTYPNPVNEILYISLPENGQFEDISFFNLDGKRVQNEVISVSTTYQKNIRKIDVSHLTPGVYFLNIASNKTTWTQRIVVY